MKLLEKLNEKLSGLRGRLEKTPARAFCWAAVIYTVLFAVIAYVFFEPANKLYGINLAGDGEDMYLPMLMNFRRTMSEFYASIRNGSPEFRMVNFDYCFGSDNYITVFNFLPLLPLYLLTPLFSESSMDEFYLVAQLVPQFLGGISFIYLCRCYGRDMLLSGLVAPAYAFTGNYFMNVVNHPQFNYMVIAFPLMVVGLDRVLERRGWKLLTFGVFFAGFSSFTFLIYTLPFLAVFALLRVWATKRKTFLSSLWKDFLLCMGAIIIGVMLTGIVLMPTLYLLFHSNRGQTDQHIKLLDLFIPQVERLGSIYIPLTKVGVYAYVMPAALMTLIPLRQKTEYKIYMLAAALVCALPLIAYGINGFMYDGYRWGFIIGLLLCYLAVAGLESFASLSRNDVFYFSLTALLFTYITTMEHEYVASVMVTAMILLLAIPPVGRAADKLADIVIGWIKKLIGWINANKDGNKRFLVALVLLVIFVPLLVLIAVDIIANNLGWERLTVGAVAGAAALIVYFRKQTKGLVTLLMLAVFTVSAVTSTIKKDGTVRFKSHTPEPIYKYISEIERTPDMTGRVEDGEKAYTWMVDNFTEEKYEKLLEDNKQTHLQLKTDSKNDPTKLCNNCLTYGVPTVANFHNMMDMDLIAFYDRIGQTADGYITLVNNLSFCGNEPVYSLFGVDTVFSHGYELPLLGQTLRETAQVDGREYRIINYDYAFPYGVTYDSYMDKSDYDELSDAYLPFALMQSAYVEGEESTAGDGLKAADRSFEHSFSMESEFFSNGVDGIDFYDNTITLTDDVSDCFIYLTFEGVTAKDLNIYNFITSVVYTDDDQYRRTFSVDNELYGWPWKRTCKIYCVPLGYKENGLKKIRFLSVFSYDNIRLHAIPRELFEKAYEARTAETLKNVELGKRSISGDITVTGDKLLSVCCLHNDGWKVYVDGEQAELCSVNDLFLGVKLGEGSHHVEFRYFTPWLKEGALLSAAGVILLIAADILLKKKTAGRDDKEETKA